MQRTTWTARRRAVMLLAGVVALGAVGVRAADPDYYTRRTTWTDTLLDSRAAWAKALAAGQAQGFTLGPWRVLGPLFAPAGKTGFATVYPPETKVDFAATCDNGKGAALKWEARAYPDGQVNDLPAGDNSATFLCRTITVAAPRKLKLYLGSDDGLTVYVNGAKVLANDVPRGAAPNQDTVEANLVAGENTVLLKINNIGGGYGFYFSTEASGKGNTALDELFTLARRDFPAAQRELEWAQADGVWAGPADEPTVARRYAEATPQAALQAEARKLAADVKDRAGLTAVQAVYHRAKRSEEAQARLKTANLAGLRAAITDLAATHGARYPGAADYLRRLTALETELTTAGDPVALGERLATLRREALLANPALDFEQILLVKRRGALGLPQNWQGNCSLGQTGYDNEIAALRWRDGTLTTVFKPQGGRFVGDLELHFDGRKLLCSMPGPNSRWAVWELGVDGSEPKVVSPSDQPDVDWFSACYLPDERVILTSTANFHGVPCVGGGDRVSLLYLLDRASGKVRQLTFDQDQSWYPKLLNNGRVVYTRWEYSDTAHYFTRLMFSMNPDGTDQRELYGSNSYWPNSMFYTRPLPGHPTKVATIVSGHHGVPRMGELLLLDPGQGRREASGVVQRVPGWNKPVPPTIADALVDGSWPRFLHPFPLSEKHLLVSCKPSASEPWGLYLVDTFDNFVPLAVDPQYALFEPVPLRAWRRPPQIPDKVDLQRKDATIYVADVYTGPGLRGVPRGTVKSLRVYSHQYAYVGMGGHINIGIDGPWDAKRILGTVPVEPDGSVMFSAPANTPLVVQPLDERGRALQVMRSWMTAMPGEMLSCVGCHESQNVAVVQRKHSAALKAPVAIRPWYGPERGFSFRREVQPVLDRYCVGCHNGSAQALPDLRDPRPETARGFSPSYLALHPYVRRPGPESDYHLQPIAEFCVNTSELFQMLEKGHHNVALDAEAWDRLTTWVDLNVPCLGAWSEERPVPGNFRQRRFELKKLYAGIDVDWEDLPPLSKVAITPITPAPLARPEVKPLVCAGWPFDAAEARRRQTAGGEATRQLDLGGGVNLELVKVPAGEFVMGASDGEPDEGPASVIRIARPFWMGKFAVTNQQFAAFDPAHDSRYVSETNKDQSRRGIPLNGPRQPAVRLSWQQAAAFCAWLSARTGERVTLPSEAQWEWAARAGTATPFWWGGPESDFGKSANLADASCVQLARANSPKWHLRDNKVNDGALVTADVGRYQPNPWGLHDMLGNAWQWTSSLYRPYPYRADDGREAAGPEGARVCRGGSWYDRPARARASFRLSYPSWQPVYNVGFRVICEVR